MKPNIQTDQDRRGREISGTTFSVSQAARNRNRKKILEKLFPEGIDRVKIWNGFVPILGGEKHEHLSVERLESVAEPKFKLKQRIKRQFPTAVDKLYLIYHGDMSLLRRITQITWSFSRSQDLRAGGHCPSRPYARRDLA